MSLSRGDLSPVTLGLLCAAIFVASWTTSAVGERSRAALVESTRVAISLAERGEFADPFAPMRTGPTAHVAPAFPAAASLVYRSVGRSPAAHELLHHAAALSLAAQAALLPLLTRAAGLGAGAGLLGAALALLAAPTPAAQWESNHVGLLMVALSALIVARGATSDGRVSARDGLIAVLWGGLILAYPVAVLIWAAWLSLETWRVGLAASWRRLLVAVVVPALLIAPWLVRNNQALGGFVFVRNNLGIEMGVSFNPCADVSLFDNMLNGCFRRHHPNRSPEQAEAVRELGELEYNRRQLAGALAFVADEPARSAQLVAGRVASFWLPSPTGDPWRELTRGGRRRESAVVYASTLLAAVGLLVVVRRRLPAAPLLAAWLLVLPLPYFVVQFSLRYRTPMMWVTFLLAGVALQAALTKVSRWAARRGRKSDV